MKTDKTEQYLSRLHSELLTIMDEIDRVCTENKIVYYLGGGSLIGAVRHKGFIPWDDDMDINMPYEDFVRFINLAPSKLRSNFYLRWITTERDYHRPFAKIAMRNTLFVEEGNVDVNSAGIFIDIFPIYPTTAFSFKHKIKKSIDNFWRGILSHKGSVIVEKSFKESLYKFCSKLMSGTFIYKMMIRNINPLPNSKSTHYACYPSCYDIHRQICPKEWCGFGKKMPFQDRYYNCPDEPYKKLELEYGVDFMQLPPLEKRRMHYPLKVMFSNGDTFEFEHVDNQVTYLNE